MISKLPLKKRHTMREFGTVFGTTQDIRANRLEERLTPLVPFPHRHSFFHLVLITSGSGWHEIDFQRHEVKPGKLFLMRPGQVHSWYLASGTRGYVLEFEDSSISQRGDDTQIVQQILSNISDHFNLPTPTVRRFIAVMQSMVEEFESHSPNFEVSLRHYLMVFLVELSRLTPSHLPNQSKGSSLDRFILLLEENFQQKHEVDYYAKRLSLTAKALTMRCSRTFGKSARTLIHDRLILEAKRLLAYSSLTIAEIGYELGFDDPNYFTRFFKEKTQTTPGVFRTTVKT